jgi:hypothetical protein
MGEVKKLAEDNLAEVRAAACECIGMTGDDDDRKILVERLKDDSWLVRASAVKAISGLLGKGSVSIISGMIGDPSLSVIESVKRGLLSHIEEVMPYLERFLYEGDAIAKTVAVEILGESGKLASLLDTLVSGDSIGKPQAMRFLKGVIKSGVHTGLKDIVSQFEDEKRKKMLEIIVDVDRVS